MTARTRRGLRTRVSTGHVVMVLAGALGVLLTLSVLRSADTTQPVLVASRDLAPGTVIDDSTVHVTRVHADASVLATLVAGDQAAALRGRVVTSTVHRGELIARASVTASVANASARLMSFSIARARAVGGNLAIGDRVDVLAVDHDSGVARYVMTDTDVVAVDGHSGGALSGSSDEVTVTLTVDRATASKLAAAIDSGTVTLVQSTGAPDAGTTSP